MRHRVAERLGVTILIICSSLLATCSSGPTETSTTATSTNATTAGSVVGTTRGSSASAPCYPARPTVQPSTLRPGQSVTLTSKGFTECAASLVAGDRLTIRMRGAHEFLGQVAPLGTVDLSSLGSFTTIVTVPDGVQPGTWVFSFDNDKFAALCSDTSSCVSYQSDPFTVTSNQ